MKDSSPFQIIVLAIAVFLIVGGVVAFAFLGGSFGGSSIGAVTIWGTVDGQTMQNINSTLRQTDKSFDTVTYVQKDAATYESDLVNAIAAGDPPDLFLLPQKDIAALQDKLQLIPYSAVSQSTFKNSFVGEGEMFLSQNGEIALPFLIDPLVMYWNNDLFSSAGIAQPPTYWGDLVNDAPKLTALDAASNLKRSAVALGLWSNIPHAKEILSTLIMQAGDPIVSQTSTGVTPVLGTNPNQAQGNPAEAALRFFADFANPSKTVYSWNRSQPTAQDAFTAGQTAVYIGFASEYPVLAARNPNLHIQVSLIPQAQGQQANITYGNIVGLAIPRGAKNPSGAVAIAQKLTSSASIALVADGFKLPPVRRDLLSAVQNDATKEVFMQSALVARAWLDPNPSGSDAIFQTMIESVVSGASTPADAVLNASQTFVRLFPAAISGGATGQ